MGTILWAQEPLNSFSGRECNIFTELIQLEMLNPQSRAAPQIFENLVRMYLATLKVRDSLLIFVHFAWAIAFNFVSTEKLCFFLLIGGRFSSASPASMFIEPAEATLSKNMYQFSISLKFYKRISNKVGIYKKVVLTAFRYIIIRQLLVRYTFKLQNENGDIQEGRMHTMRTLSSGL